MNFILVLDLQAKIQMLNGKTTAKADIKVSQVARYII